MSEQQQSTSKRTDTNIAVLTGNLGRDPEMRFTPAGKPTTRFSLASNRAYTNAGGETVSETTWVNIECWGKLAEIANQFLHKGSRVLVEGRLKPFRTYQKSDGSGQGYSGIEITADRIQFLNGPRQNGEGQAEGAEEEVIDFNA